VYEPVANFHGTDSFTYVANDGALGSTIATATITVHPVNDAPSAGDDTYTTDEDTALEVVAPGVLGNDHDVDGDTITTVLVDGPTHGTLTLDADGSFTYEPDADFHGADSFTYRASDGDLTSDIATVAITVDAANDAPTAADDSYDTDEDTALVVAAGDGLLVNDGDIDGDDLTAVVVDQPAHGTLTAAADGSFTYTPEADSNGTDEFTYVANDGTAGSELATVTITVHPVNDAPVAADDEAATPEDTTLTVDADHGVLANDHDIDSTTLTVALFSGVNHGSLTFNPDGSYSYTPAANFHGTDSFTYTANDGSLGSNVATVTITVDPVNDAPTAGDDSYTTDEDTALTVDVNDGVLSNDGDIDGDTLHASVATDPAHGTLTLEDDGSFSYEPEADWNGVDTFTYEASDGTDAVTATVTITVDAVNDAPQAGGDSYTTDEDTTLTVDANDGVLGNDADAEGSGLVATLVTPASHGTVTLAADGSFVYTPAANFHGIDSFGYTVNDGSVASSETTVTITVTSVNDAPTAADDTYTTAEDTALVVTAAGVLGNDGDVDGDALTAVVVDQPAHGTVVLHANGAFTYTPAANYNGADSFTYKANDGSLDSNVVTVHLTVDAMNDAPSLGTIGNQTVNETSNLTFTASGNDIDVPAQPLTYSLANGTTSCGSVTSCIVPVGATINASSGVFSWTPTAAQGPGTYRFFVQVSDGVATTAQEITVTVNDVVVSTPKLVFTTAARTTTVGTSTALITVQRQNAAGAATTSGSLAVNLTTTGPGGFRNSADTAAITSVTIPSGSSTVSFRYRSTSSGTPTITAAKAGYASASQVVTIGKPKLVFTTAARSAFAGTPTGTITVQRQSFTGSATTSGALKVNLTTTGPGVFRNTADSATITSITIANGASSASFRYRSPSAGTPTMTATASGYTAGSQSVTIKPQPPKLVITTAARTAARNVSTSTITVQRQTNAGAAQTSGALVVDLTTSGPGGFRNSGDTAAITSVTIPNGSSSVSFRYRSSTVGKPTITVSASGYVSASQTVTIDTAPTFSGLSSSYSMRRNTTRTVSFQVNDVDTGGSNVTLSASSSNTKVLANSGITFPDNSSVTRSIRFAPKANATGTTTITITATDGILKTTLTFTLVVTK
jgi:VCBS repeat-containing protein